MATIKINTSGITSNVIPPLKTANSKLSTASTTISSISIPSDFSYKSTLRGTTSTISSIKTSVTNISTWASNVANKFNSAETKSKNVVNSMLAKKISTSAKKTSTKVTSTKKITTVVKNSTSKTTYKLANIAKTGAKIATKVTSTVASKAKSALNATKTKITTVYNTVINKITSTVSSVIKSMQSLAQKITTGIKSVGAKVATGVKSAALTIISFEKKVMEVEKRIGATIANLAVSFVKGVCDFVESLFDAVVIIVTGVLSIVTGVMDGVSYLISMANGTTDEWTSITANMWKNTMAFVATDHVGNVFSSFYENTAVGKWLDENAYSWAKSDGIGSQIAEGIGYVAGVIALSVATLGIGTAVTGVSTGASVAVAGGTMATTSAIVAATAGLGKYTAEYWENAKVSSWAGVTEMYENGEISEDDYNAMQQIRDLTDDEWNSIVEMYNNGKISEDEYQAMLAIREMSEDWTTSENLLKGLAYGTANGVWEGLQWYVGGKLAGWSINGATKLATSSVRVGVDTLFNGTDTFFRTGISALTTDETLQEAWKNQGAWSSVMASVLIGGIASAGGEAFGEIAHNVKVKDTTTVTLASNVKNSNFNSIDDVIEYTLRKYGVTPTQDLIQQYKTEILNGNYSRITRDLGAREFATQWAKLQTNLAGTVGYYSDYDFSNYSRTGKYGVDQGLLKDFYCFQTADGTVIKASQYKTYLNAGYSLEKRATTAEYFEVKAFLESRYNLSSKDAAKIITALDSIGACSYADACNELVEIFRNEQLATEFTNATGIRLFKNTNGTFEINDSELLVDLFMFANDTANGGKLITTLPDGTKTVNIASAITDSNRVTKLASEDVQQYFMYSFGMNEDLINKYLSSYGISEKYATSVINSAKRSSLSNQEMSDVINSIVSEMQSGKQISLYISSRGQSEISFINPETGATVLTTANWKEKGGAHAVYVTGYNDVGVIVSSWGEKLVIPWADLQASGAFAFFSSELTDAPTLGLWDKIKGLFN